MHLSIIIFGNKDDPDQGRLMRGGPGEIKEVLWQSPANKKNSIIVFGYGIMSSKAVEYAYY